MWVYYLLLFTSPFYHHPIFDRGFGSLTVVKAIGAVAALYAMFYLMQRGRFPRYFATRQAKLFLTITLLALFSFAIEGRMWQWGADPALSYFSFLIFLVVTLSVLDSPDKIWWSLAACLAGLAFGALYMIREWAKYHGLYRQLRPTIIGDPNYYTLAAILILPVGYFWLLGRMKRMHRWAVLGMLVLVSVAMALAASRGGFVALIVGCLYVLLTSRKRVRNFTMLTLLLGGPMVVLPQSPLNRFLNPRWGDQKAVLTRVATWHAGLNMVEHNPIRGVGLGMFKPALQKYSGDPTLHEIAHNTYLEYAAELGIPTLLIFLWLLLETYRALRRARRAAEANNEETLYLTAKGLECGLVSFVVGCCFLSAETLKLFWILVFTSIPLERLARERATKSTKLEKAA